MQAFLKALVEKSAVGSGSVEMFAQRMLEVVSDVTADSSVRGFVTKPMKYPKPLFIKLS